LNWLVGTLPVTAKNGKRIGERIAGDNRQVCRARPAGGEGSRSAARYAVVDIRHEAGDALVMHEMVLMSSDRSYSASMNWILPWPHNPNTCGTFSGSDSRQ